VSAVAGIVGVLVCEELFYITVVLMQFVVCIGMCWSFGLAPAQQLTVPSPLMPNQSNNISLPVSMTGVIQRMDPLTNLQVSFLHLHVIFTNLHHHIFSES